MNQEHVQAERRRRSSAEVSELVAQYLTSGLTQTEFCRQHGLDLSTLRRRVAGRPRPTAQGSAATNWIAVQLSPSSDAKAEASASGRVLAVGVLPPRAGAGI